MDHIEVPAAQEITPYGSMLLLTTPLCVQGSFYDHKIESGF